MVKKAKLYMIKRPKATEAQTALREAFETFYTPELSGFFIMAWDKGADPLVSLHSVDMGLVEIATACQMELQTLHTMAAIAQNEHTEEDEEC